MDVSRSDSPLSRSLLLSLYLPSLLLSICNGLLIPVLPVFATGLDAPYALAGLILAGESIGILLADFPAGLPVSRLGRQRPLLAALVVCAFRHLPLASNSPVP